jgi:glycosyltransferase involved in cell wall biosynthesis
MLVRALKELLGEESVHCVAMPEGLNHGGTKSRRLPGRSKLRFCGRALWEAARWRPDVIICTHLALGPIGWFVSGLGGRPYWAVVHGIEAWGVLPGWKRIALREAERVIATSLFSRQQVVKRHQLDEERVASLPCALDETLLNVEPVRDGLHRRLPGDRRVVLTVARMEASERYKGHEVVLQALASVAAKVPNVTYVVAGDGDDRTRLESLARQLGWQNTWCLRAR